MSKCSSENCDNYANPEHPNQVCNKCFFNWKPFGPNYKNKPLFLLPWEDANSHREVVQRSSIVDHKMAERCGVGDDDDLTQYYDTEEILKEKVQILTEAIRNSKHLVAYTGAGVSVSAGIGDFRGPNGSWTLAARGIKDDSPHIPLNQLVPTFAHKALVKLYQLGILKCLVTTNCDGLHSRSGFPDEGLCELHGSAFLERCERCGKEYRRDKPIRHINGTKYTGSRCEIAECDGHLTRTVVAFSESLPESHLNRAKEHSKQADVALVLGTSMRVKPACYLPELCWFHSKLDESVEPGKFFLVNLQKTSYDPHAYVRLFHTTDRVMQMLMDNLGITVD